MFEFLKDRGLRFCDEARGDFEKGYYDFCLFHSEQMVQLLLKYLIAVKIDDFPRIHSISRLFKEVANLYGQGVMDFYRDNISIITALEEAYVGARYIDIEFDKEIAAQVLDFGERFLMMVEEIRSRGH
ncbi:MAG: HEPN domain-containing protein [Thermodesulfobacteriota bacterium]